MNKREQQIRERLRGPADLMRHDDAWVEAYFRDVKYLLRQLTQERSIKEQWRKLVEGSKDSNGSK